MRKKLSYILFFLLFSLQIHAEETKYTLEDSTLIIHDGVTDIYRGDFRDLQNVVKHIYFPNSLRKIDSYSFRDFKELTSINSTDSIREIGRRAFYGCVKLNQVLYYDGGRRCHDWVGCRDSFPSNLIIHDGVTNIDPCAFQVCKNLKKLVLPESLDTIGFSAFEYCRQLESIDMPKGIRHVGKDAFGSCDNINSLLLIDNDTKCVGWIGKDCPKHIQIPNTVKSIEPYAFMESELETIDLPDGLDSICTDAFMRSNIKSINVPNSVSYIGPSAFYGCEQLESVALPKGLKHIGIMTFFDCRSLKNVTFPSCSYTVGEGAFRGCSHIHKPRDLSDCAVSFTSFERRRSGKVLSHIGECLVWVPVIVLAPIWIPVIRAHGGLGH